MVHQFLYSNKVFKLDKKFDGKDFGSDLIEFYSDVRKKIAQMYKAENFGPLEFPNKEYLDYLDWKGLPTHKRNIDHMPRLVKCGYGRI